MQPGIGRPPPRGGGRGQVISAPSSTGDEEAPKDPGARITHQSYTEKDYEGKFCPEVEKTRNLFSKISWSTGQFFATWVCKTRRLIGLIYLIISKK